MYEVLYMSRSNIVFARHLLRVYLHWPLTIKCHYAILNKEESSTDNQSEPAGDLQGCLSLGVCFFFSAVVPAASPPVCLFHAVFRRQRKLLTLH